MLSLGGKLPPQTMEGLTLQAGKIRGLESASQPGRQRLTIQRLGVVTRGGEEKSITDTGPGTNEPTRR